jgi:peptidoglycan hydrolase-like protein with peptidoglycan-binding domain
MNAALGAHGYKQADQPLYKAFQAAARLTADGYPGTGTMTALASVLQGMGVPMAPVRVYPWHSKPGMTGYDGVNAPTVAEWTGAAPPPVVPPVVPPGAPSMQKPGPVSPYPGPGAWQTNGAYIARYQRALTYLSQAMAQPAWNTQGVDSHFGPHTQAAVTAFQVANGLSADGKAGADTAAAIDRLLAVH